MTERQTQRRQDAKPQGIGRRAFVTLGLGSGAAALLAACGWDGGTLVRPGLWSISRVNDWVGETLLYSPTRLARTYPASERSAALPSYFISRTMPMLRDPATWRLRVDGLVAQPLELSLDDLMRLPSPTKLGYKLTKYLMSMTFMDQRPGGYWEDQEYPWFGGI